MYIISSCNIEILGNNFKMNQEENTFFATQIAQKSADPIEQPSQQTPEVTTDPSPKQQQNIHSLRDLLTAFNSHDKQEKGLITVEAAQSILSTKQINIKDIKEYHEMSLPMFQGMVSFDQFLFIFCLSENTSQNMLEKYELCRTVDERLIDFLKLLNNYRKKSEKNGNYKEAKNSKKKVEQIKGRQLERRNKYLKILYENQLISTEQKQKSKFQQFCKKWDHFMNQYEATAADLIRKVKERQAVDIKEFQDRTRQQLALKIHFSKYLLELQTKQKNLVKVQEYEKAASIQIQIEQLKAKQLKDKELADQEVIELRLRSFRKQQQSTISTLLQKIQKDRNDHLKQRQSETQKLLIRNKSQLSEIDHRFNETVKRIYQALNNMGIDSEKNIKAKR